MSRFFTFIILQLPAVLPAQEILKVKHYGVDQGEDDFADYVELEKMDSRESFQVMEAFAEQIKDNAFQERLYKALSRPKPFHNFKYEIDDAEYRTQWFQFKDQQEFGWVEEQL